MTSSAISAEQREKQKITRCNLNFTDQDNKERGLGHFFVIVILFLQK
jgi:hypothetical protein